MVHFTNTGTSVASDSGTWYVTADQTNIDITTTAANSTVSFDTSYVSGTPTRVVTRTIPMQVRIPTQVQPATMQLDYPDHAPRGFNRYLNASDLMEEFIKDLGVLGIKQGEFVDLPVMLFLNWLVIRAAEADEDAPPVKVNHCQRCGRFTPGTYRRAALPFCTQHISAQRRLAA